MRFRTIFSCFSIYYFFFAFLAYFVIDALHFRNTAVRCFFLYENNNFRNYRKDQECNEYWRCTINGCKAHLTMSNDSGLIEFISSHTHGDTVQNESVQTLRTACKRKATETVGERPSKVIKTCLKDHGESHIKV